MSLEKESFIFLSAWILLWLDRGKENLGGGNVSL
jgi:hypothetical protein